MNIYVESNGAVHFEDIDNTTLELHTQGDVTLYHFGAYKLGTAAETLAGALPNIKLNYVGK